ncbi:MAG: NERD domain protein, partial [Micrococcales bacterium]
MRLRYAGVCRLCGTDLPARADAIYERSTKTVRCVQCQTET